MDRFLSDIPGPYYVLEHDRAGLLACGGYASAANRSVAVLCWGMVRREWQGQGLGKQLLGCRLKEIVSAGGYREVAIETSQHSRGFYERFGFKVTKFIPGGFAPGMDLFEMTLTRSTLIRWRRGF